MTRYHNRHWRRSDVGMGNLMGVALIVLVVAGSLVYAVGVWVLLPIALIAFILSKMD